MIKVSDPVRYEELMQTAIEAVKLARSYLPDSVAVAKHEREPLYFCARVQADLRVMRDMVQLPVTQVDLYADKESA